MKILRVVSSGFEEGGVENGIVLLKPIFEAMGHEVRVLSSDAHPELKHFNDYSYKMPRGLLRRLQYTWNGDAYRALKKVLRDFKPDVVQLHTIGHASPSIFFALKDTPTVATIHGPEGYTKNLLKWCLPPEDFVGGTYDEKDLTTAGKLRLWYYTNINYPLFNRAIKHVDVFVTLSRYMQGLMREEGIECKYVPNGTTLLPHKPIEGEVPHTLLYVGRLEKFKGIAYLLEAMVLIAQKFADAHLMVVGDGRDRQELIALAQSLGLERHVTFLGHKPRAEVAQFYEKSAALVLPSVWPEAFGKVGIEAMSVGRPVVGSNVGGIPDWLHDGENGFLVEPKNSRAIADAVIKLFSDSSLYAKLSQNARATAEQFDLSHHAQKMLEIYGEISAQAIARETKDSR